VKRVVVGALLRVYSWVATSGVLDRPRARRAFEAVYLEYKARIEAGPIDHLRPYAAPGTSVIDVGANIGFFAVRFGRWVGAQGRVYAIEPEARNVASLRERVERAGLAEVVECRRAAASEQTGTVHLVLNPIHPGDHHLGAEGEPVAAVTLDDLTADDPRTVGLIKIDVQGAELLVLAGAERVLTEHRPAIFIEVDDPSLQRFGSSAGELLRKLADRGYTGHVLTKAGLGPAEAPEELAARTAASYIDVLFLPDGGVTAGTPA
jgi:FkbM family methyltransferase